MKRLKLALATHVWKTNKQLSHVFEWTVEKKRESTDEKHLLPKANSYKVMATVS